MSASQCAPESGLANSTEDLALPEPKAASAGASGLLKGLLIGFAVTVGVALGLASWYVGERIVAANEVVPASNVVQGVAVAAPARELYLQVASLGPKPDSSFVKQMEARGYRARVQNANNSQDTRILIGPFAERSSLEEAERNLQSAGVLAIETAY